MVDNNSIGSAGVRVVVLDFSDILGDIYSRLPESSDGGGPYSNVARGGGFVGNGAASGGTTMVFTPKAKME